MSRNPPAFPCSGSSEPTHGRTECLVELCRRAGRGDPVALDLLLQGIQAPVQRYLAGRLSSWPDGDDLAGDLRQEVLIRAAAALPQCRFESEQRLMAWVLRIARHVLVDHVRAARVRRETVPRLTLEQLAEDVSLERWRSSGAANSQVGLLEAVAAEAMMNLPEHTRELLRLRVQLGLTWKEVGHALGTTEAAAKRRFQRTQASLRFRLRDAVRALSPGERERLPAWAAELAGPR